MAVIVAVVVLLLFTVGVPVSAVLLLRHNRHQLEREHFRRRYGLLYDGFKHE